LNSSNWTSCSSFPTISPHKLDRTQHLHARVEMLRAAIEGEPQFCSDTLELERPAPPSLSTPWSPANSRAGRAIVYLIGENNVRDLHWHRFAELSKMVQFAVLDRTGFENRTFIPDRPRTSTFPRLTSETGLRGHPSLFVPPGVEKIIRERQL